MSRGKVLLATVYGDVHDIGKNLIKTILANNGYSVLDLGKQVPVAVIVDQAVEFEADAIGLSALLVSTSRQMPLVVRELDRRGLAIPVLVGGAAIDRDFGRDIARVEDDRPYAGGVFYCRDAFEGLDRVDRLMNQPAGAPPPAPEPETARARRRPVPAETSAATTRSVFVARLEDVPAPPFWGARALTALPLEEVLAMLDERQLFRLSWGAKAKLGAEWEQLRQEFGARLERMKRETLEDPWLAPQSVYGYFPVLADGNDLVVFDPGDHEKAFLRFSFPREPGGEHRCLADFFLSLGSPRSDVAAIQVVTVGTKATERFDAMDRRDEYSEAYYLHGLAVQTAEATAKFVFERIRQELGLTGDRGRRYSWGFGALPDVEEHRKVFRLLPAAKELGMSLTSAGQLVPEQSTVALVVHHPGAHYFST